VKLDQHLSSLYATGTFPKLTLIEPVFDGMPKMHFGDKPIDWRLLTKDVVNFYAPSIPYKYLWQLNESQKKQAGDASDKLQPTAAMSLQQTIRKKLRSQ